MNHRETLAHAQTLQQRVRKRFAVGQSCWEPYEIDAVLGASTDANVALYRACLPSSSARDSCGYAVKFFSLENDPIRIAEFKREVDAARAMGQLGVGPNVYTANICAHARTFEPNWAAVLVMERLDGVLPDLVKRLKPADVKRLIRKINDKVTRMHSAGWGHGDLHEENIGFRASSRPDRAYDDVFLIDFGRAFSISNGQKDPRVVDDMKLFRLSYDQYVHQDYTNWRSEFGWQKHASPELTTTQTVIDRHRALEKVASLRAQHENKENVE